MLSAVSYRDGDCKLDITATTTRSSGIISSCDVAPTAPPLCDMIRFFSVPFDSVSIVSIFHPSPQFVFFPFVVVCGVHMRFRVAMEKSLEFRNAFPKVATSRAVDTKPPPAHFMDKST